ncbi:cytochrome P450 [Irpex rosettiformis]|uniref:Cytochrome P450 n=1 Tax=Irpex rosettiformis TaxID=378272 RepID=A0ACB8UG28_9APHY|nr:cytochrome P450 [Irpex rosettiformis]
MNSLAVLGGILACAVLARLASKKRRKLPLPPGPPAEPLIGHLRIFPDPASTAEVFHGWSVKYGDVFSLQVPGETVIVLASEKAASDLLEKRSAIYSDRIRFGYYDSIGWGDAIILAPYGPFLTRQHKLFSDAFGKGVVHVYRGVQEREANILLKGLLDDPNDFDRHAIRFAGGIVTDVGYGHHIDSLDDDFFSMGERFLQYATAVTAPSLLDLHPRFAYLPPWVPGAWFVKFIKETKPFMDAILNNNFQRVVEQITAGTARPSFVASNIEAMYGEKHDAEHERATKLAAVMIFAAGFETTWRAVTIFIAVMLLYPEVQEKAQEEIDRVIGRDRLPDLGDRDSLPYVQCVINEVMRWEPIVPFGLPHRSVADDVYNGMHIPKGSIVFANTRSLTWDESKFHEPQKFKPERFLPKPEGAGEIFPASAVFGWGRRVCAGRYLAEGSLWTAAARILAVFAISPEKDANGQSIKPNIKFTTMLTRSVVTACKNKQSSIILCLTVIRNLLRVIFIHATNGPVN